MKVGVDPSSVVISSEGVESDAMDVYSTVVDLSVVAISGTVVLTIAGVVSSCVVNRVEVKPEVGCVSVVVSDVASNDVL